MGAAVETVKVVTDWVVVGGRQSSKRSVIVVMPRGYDIPVAMDASLDAAWGLPAGRHLVRGSLDNPQFGWPQIAFVKDLP